MPRPRPGLVSRPRLLTRLDESASKKLLIISAAAGFGKTTLVSEWLHRQDSPAAWLSLDPGDNDRARFLAYFIAAIQTVYPEIGEESAALLRASQQASVESLLTPLILALDALPEPFIIVLDDYHLIENEEIHNSVTFLLDFLPEQIQLILVARHDPPLRLGRLRATGQLAEFRATDLRFSNEETKAFLTESMGVAFTDKDVDVLEERTEGWAAGLQLVVLAMQGRPDPAGYLQSVHGSQRFIVAYLLEEVFHQQEEAVQEFLLKTAILERMNAPLCNRITSRQDGREILAGLMQSNLFLIPLDDSRQWFRYHHLFSEFLHDLLVKKIPGELSVLHLRAARWFEEEGLSVEAIGHALAAGHHEYAASLIESVSRTMMNGQFPLATILGWLGALPEDLVRRRPRLSLMYSWWLVWSAQFEDAEMRLVEVENHLALMGKEISPAARSFLHGEVALVRANIAYAKVNLEATFEYAQEALDRLPGDEILLRSLAALFLGHAFRLQGEPSAALDAYRQITRPPPSLQFVPAVIIARGHFPQLWAVQGQLWEGKLAHEQTLRYITERRQSALPAAGITYVDTAAIWYEWNELDKTAAFLQTGIRLCRNWEALLESQVDAHVLMAHVKQAQGDTSGRDHWLQEALHLANSHGLPQLAARAEVYRARLWIEEGNLNAMQDWTAKNNLAVDSPPAYPLEGAYAILARLLIAQGDYLVAHRLLDDLRTRAEASGRVKNLIEYLCLQALTLYAQDQYDRALKGMRHLLSLAEPHGYIRTFLDEGQVMLQLIRMAATHGVHPAYAARILEAAQRDTVDERQPLVEPLTRRELEILGLISDGLSNREIALKLVIAESTVKRHVANIYGKLNVGSRTQAIARARDLNLLQ